MVTTWNSRTYQDVNGAKHFDLVLRLRKNALAKIRSINERMNVGKHKDVFQSV